MTNLVVFLLCFGGVLAFDEAHSWFKPAGVLILLAFVLGKSLIDYALSYPKGEDR